MHMLHIMGLICVLFTDMSAGRWQRRRSSDGHDINLYNIQEQLVIVEGSEAKRSVYKENPSTREKRNPLLEKVKNTKLSCFKSSTGTNTEDSSCSVCFVDEFTNEKQRYCYIDVSCT